MQYVFKSVHELTPDEVRRYLELYNSTFDRDLSYGEFYYKFTRQMGPNSYFVFMVDDQAGIVGSLGAIEVDYTFGGEQIEIRLDGGCDDRAGISRDCSPCAASMRCCSRS